MAALPLDGKPTEQSAASDFQIMGGMLPSWSSLHRLTFLPLINLFHVQVSVINVIYDNLYSGRALLSVQDPGSWKNEVTESQKVMD